MIPEHYKFSFLPDKDLRELVNKPFSFFETTELDENIDFSDMDVSADGPEEKEAEDESVEEVVPEEERLPQEKMFRRILSLSSNLIALLRNRLPRSCTRCGIARKQTKSFLIMQTIM